MSIENEIKHLTDAIHSLVSALRDNAGPVAKQVESTPVAATKAEAPLAVVDGNPAKKLTFEDDIRPLAVELLRTNREAFDAIRTEFKVAKFADIKDQKLLVKVHAALEAAKSGAKAGAK